MTVEGRSPDKDVGPQKEREKKKSPVNTHGRGGNRLAVREMEVRRKPRRLLWPHFCRHYQH